MGGVCKATDDVFKLINFVAVTDESEAIGYWRGPSHTPLNSSPLVYYDTEGQFQLCGTRFVESLFFLNFHYKEGLERLREAFSKTKRPLDFDSADDLETPKLECPPNELRDKKYEEYLV